MTPEPSEVRNLGPVNVPRGGWLLDTLRIASIIIIVLRVPCVITIWRERRH